MDMATEALELLVTETAAFLWPPALCAERLVVKAKCMLAVSTSETASPKNSN